jgi:hypothetical protein
MAGALVVAACSTAPRTVPAPAVIAQPVQATAAAALVDHEGDSVETAVTVPVDVPDEVRFENLWIFDRFGKFRRQHFAVANQEGRHYDLITFELPDGSVHTAYFDISDLWKKWGRD